MSIVHGTRKPERRHTPRRTMLFGILCLPGIWGIEAALAASPKVTDAGPEFARSDTAGTGEIVRLHAVPAAIHLRGPDAGAQVVITAVHENGGVRDVTGQVELESSSPGIVDAGASGQLIALADGSTVLSASLGGHSLEIPVEVTDTGAALPIHFANDIVPIFSKHGCNTGGCHGKSGGQNGFALSLFGFDPRVDFKALTQGSRARRVFPAHPEHSLLLRKASGSLPHGGGVRLTPGTFEYRLLARWMRSGMPYGDPQAPKLDRVEAFPRQRVLGRMASQQLRVTAVYTDGRREDVTSLAEYSVAEKTYLSVDESGRVTALGTPGLGAVLVRYRGLVDVFTATISSGRDGEELTFPSPASFVDELVFGRLRTLGIPASKLSSDVAFLRRSSLDICGTLPSPGDIESFLADDDPQRRRRWIDRLLERPEYADVSALYWADILRNRRGNQQRAAPLTVRFHRWIRQHFLANTPYDEFVRELICAEGNIVDSPAVGWYRELNNAKALADDTAQVFLGTRMQCARCHHHPFEKWSQDDYWQFANFFARVRPQNRTDDRTFTVTLQRGVSRLRDDEETSASYQETYQGLRAPGGEPVEERPGIDPRHLLVDWMRDQGGDLFARAVVNRYWKRFLGRGLVEPEDDLRATNPPSNPELLEALARDFVDSGFDLKHLVRRICNSRTYQLSAEPVEGNGFDRQNFSHFQPRRLGAELLLDAVDTALGTSTRFNDMRRGARAIELPDEASRNYFLDVFGKPQRMSACACERSDDVTLSQILHLLSSEDIHRKLRDGNSLPARFARSEEADAKQVRELFLRVLARPPTERERERSLAYLHELGGDGKDRSRRQQAWEDLTWALLNTKEFALVR